MCLRNSRLVIVLGELNNLDLWGADIGNAYWEAYTHVKLFMIAGAEPDDTELLTGESIQHYLAMIGQLQWLVALGRFGIHAQVSPLFRFKSAPRKGHLVRLPMIYAYVRKGKHYSIRERTKGPDCRYVPNLMLRSMESETLKSCHISPWGTQQHKSMRSGYRKHLLGSLHPCDTVYDSRG